MGYHACRGHYHSRTEGCVLPVETAFLCSGARRPDSLPPERVLAAGRPLLAAAQPPLAVPRVVQPQPRPSALEEGWGKEGQVKGECGWSPAGRVRLASLCTTPASYLRNAGRSVRASRPLMSLAPTPRSGPDPSLGFPFSTGLFCSSWEGGRERLPAAAGRRLGDCKQSARNRHLEPSGGRGAGDRDWPCLRDPRPRAVGAAPSGSKALWPKSSGCGRASVRKV